MFFAWLKQYMPRSLYGRAALILIVPIIGLQLVVSIVFIQRHFEEVTSQMSRSMALELALVVSELEASGQSNAAAPLHINVQMPAPDNRMSRRRWYDFAGIVVKRELHESLPALEAVDLPNGGKVHAYVQTGAGLAELTFARARVSALNPHQLLVNMVFFGILMTVIAYIYLRNQLRPIKRLARAAAAFGRGNVIDYKPSGAVEVRAAGHAFLDMRNRIERAIDQRTLMLSGVSHDLRTPLTRMKLGLSLLDDEDREPLERDVQEMQRMLDEFLSFAKGAHEGEPEMSDPIALVRGIVDDCQRAGMPVQLGEFEGEGELALRRVGIRRAIENLIGNAVRYGTNAVVSVALTERALRIRVEDDGPGIAAEQREEAQRPFTRLDASRNQNRGSGVGLGLSIATDVARAHGGMLRLGESSEMGGLRADIVIAR
ncbi:HAMP domain-containing protein [Lentibacter algarum]|uniref:ATP-binding protein n=1 Tax=Lentibacter algarum TaxID=576131 RepID=UPI001C06A839|nr:ATP-binding protein [Lentibacter algarum]MBU2982173.1 HAMP domain-containing protein [Lentibacter algarum]